MTLAVTSRVLACWPPNQPNPAGPQSKADLRRDFGGGLGRYLQGATACPCDRVRCLQAHRRRAVSRGGGWPCRADPPQASREAPSRQNAVPPDEGKGPRPAGRAPHRPVRTGRAGPVARESPGGGRASLVPIRRRTVRPGGGGGGHSAVDDLVKVGALLPDLRGRNASRRLHEPGVG
jgi:hypothetical protein